MRLLRQTYFAFLRKLLYLGPEAHVSNQTALVKTNTADVRILLALDHLRYARKVCQISPEITQNRVHLEFAECQDSWLHGLFADLVWLGQVLPNAIPNIKELQKEDLTSMIEAWQRPEIPWKSSLKRALQKHLLQDHMMSEVHALHERAFNALKQAEAKISGIDALETS